MGKASPEEGGMEGSEKEPKGFLPPLFFVSIFPSVRCHRFLLYEHFIGQYKRQGLSLPIGDFYIFGFGSEHGIDDRGSWLANFRHFFHLLSSV